MFLTRNDIRILLQTQKTTFQTYRYCIHTNFVTKFTVRANAPQKRLLFDSVFFRKKTSFMCSKMSCKSFILLVIFERKSLVICPGKCAPKSRHCLFLGHLFHHAMQAEHTACSVRLYKRKRQMSSELFGTFLLVIVYRAHMGEFGLAVLSVP